jgi:hypothetical protein
VKVQFVPISGDNWWWVTKQTDAELTPRTKGIVAISDDGRILACAVFDSWTYSSAQVHIAIENRLAIRHGFIEECMHYFFNSCDRKVLIGLTPSNNERALKFIKNVGFVELFRVKDGFDVGVDYVVQEMRKENCRWING